MRSWRRLRRRLRHAVWWVWLALASSASIGHRLLGISRRNRGWMIPTATGVTGIVLMILLLLNLLSVREFAPVQSVEESSIEVDNESAMPAVAADIKTTSDEKPNASRDWWELSTTQTDSGSKIRVSQPSVASFRSSQGGPVESIELDESAPEPRGQAESPSVIESQPVREPENRWTAQTIERSPESSDPFWESSTSAELSAFGNSTVTPPSEPSVEIGFTLTHATVPGNASGIRETGTFSVSSRMLRHDPPAEHSSLQWASAVEVDDAGWQRTASRQSVADSEWGEYQGKPLSESFQTVTSSDVVDPSAADLPDTQESKLHVEKQIPATCTIGRPVEWSVLVRNDGTGRVMNVVIEETLPQSVRLLIARPDARWSAGILRWHIASLDSGEQIRLVARVLPVEQGILPSGVVVHATTLVASRTLVQQPELSIAIHCPEQVTQGALGVLWFDIKNVSPVPASHVALNVDLPSQVHNPYGNELIRPVGLIRPGETRKAKLTVQGISSGDGVIRAGATIGEQLADETGDVLRVVAAPRP